MIIGVDHALIAVDDLETGMRTYRRLGFEVVRGGTHPQHGTHNALVPMADGFYLELMGVWDRALASQHPHTNQVLAALEREDRLALFALDSDDLDGDVARIRGRGLGISEPVPGERERPDGERVAWRTAHPDDPRLPFLIEDVTPRSVRVPEPESGIGTDLRVEAILAAVRSETRTRYAELLGGNPPDGPSQFGRGTLVVQAGSVDADDNRSLRLVLATDDRERLRSVWVGQDVAFEEETMSDGRPALVPEATGGATLWIAERLASPEQGSRFVSA